jgi:RHS repeat-associated protein
MFKKKAVNDKQILVLVRLLNTSKKFLVFLALFGQLVSIFPSRKVDAVSETKENDLTVEESTDYQSDELDISLVPIVNEDESRRTANEKHFRKLDGTYEVSIYDNEVHYYEDGKWNDINNSLNDNGNYLENKNNSFKTIFPKNLSENKTIGIKSKDYTIDWKVLDTSISSAEYINAEKKQSLSTELIGINQSVTYKNVRNQVDLQYILQGSDVKEYIILNEYYEDFSMSFEYILKNLKLVQSEEGIYFLNQSDESVFKFDDLFMVDRDGKLSHDVEYEITETEKDTYQITIQPNDDWLAEASYPVMIDPTLVSTTTSMSIWDTYISQANPTINYASSQYMYLSNTSSSAQYKGLIYFTIPSAIMNQVITYAHLSFTPYITATNAQLNIYKNTKSFISNQVTWESWHLVQSYDETVVDYHIVKSESPFVFDIIKPIKEWQAEGISTIHGFTIAHDDGSGSVNAVYQNGASNATSRPVVKIGYEEPSGLKDYWSYTSQNVGMIGTGYISDYTGNLTWVRNEYQLQNEYLSMTLSFFHNNFSRSVDIGYGDGWRTNYTVEIKYDSTSSLYYMHKPDGNKIYFMNNVCTVVSYYDQQCTAIAEDGSGMVLERLTVLGQNYNMKVTTTSDLEYNFNGSGRLSSIRNIKTNHSLGIAYIDTTSLKIDYATDEADNKIDFIYSESTLTQTTLDLKQDNGLYRQVEKRDYYYDTYNNLDYIDYDFRYGNGSSTGWTTDTTNRLHYYFDSNNRLINAYNEKDNFKIQYNYDTKSRINSISTTDDGLNLGLMTVTYDNSKTTYTDYEGNSIYYTFDQYGHTVNVMDDFGKSTYYRYSGLFSYMYNYGSYVYGYDLSNITPNYLNNHNLVEKSNVMMQQQNPIQNHGFEEGTYGWTLNEGTGSIVFSSEKSMLGEKSLMITRISSLVYANQQVYLSEGEYTIEGWIMNSGDAPGAYIDVDNVTSKGTLNTIFNCDEWTKYELTFTIENSQSVNVKLINDSNNSDAYFDNVQISKGFVDTRYNSVSNNSFENDILGWTVSGATVSAIGETGVLSEILGSKAIQINGDAGIDNQVNQKISYVNGYNGRSFMIGGWAKADAVPNKGYLVGEFLQRDNRFFGLIVILEMAAEIPGPNVFESFYFPFNPAIEDWQYQMNTINIDRTIFSARIYASYNGEGIAYFDNIQLFQEDLSTIYSYDESTGNLTAVAKPDGTTTVLGYDTNGNITSIIQDDKTIEIERNSTYQVEEVLSSNNVRTTFVYDSATKQLMETYVGYDKDSSSQYKWFKSSTTYTSDGQYVNSVTNEFGNTTSATIDKTIGTVTQMVDAIGNIQSIYYDEYGNLKSMYISDMTTGASIPPYLYGSYTYDEYGRLWKINRDSYSYEFVYDIDGLNQIVGVKIANLTVMSYEYWMDESGVYHTGLMKTQTYGNTDYIGFIYTDENQIESICFNGTIRYEYTYDSSGYLSIFKDIHNDNIYFYSYDLAGRLEIITDKGGNEITYQYDESGNIDRYYYNISGVSRAVTYNYNHTTGDYDYTLYSVSGTTIKKDFNYDTDSLKRLNSIDLIIGTNTFKKILGYDDAKVDSTMGNATNRIYQITYQKNTATQYIHQFSYDENHNITQILIGLPWEIREEYNYFYDGFNQLIREDIWISGLLSKTMVYSYDLQNNITSVKTYAYQVTTGTAQHEKKMYYQNTWKDQLTKIEYHINGLLSYYQTFSYDASGNVTNLVDSRTSYAYKNFQWDGRQLSIYSAYCNSISFKYNDQGIRTRKAQGTCSGNVITNYTLDGDRVLVESRSNGITLYFTYDIDGTLLSMNYNGTEYFYITNLQGDIIELVDINGNSVVKYKYDAWGNIINQTGGSLADINPYRYRGYRFDVETGWYYLQSRYYDPAIGRFISADGLIGETGDLLTHNMYAYCANNPVMYSDTSGKFPEWILDVFNISDVSSQWFYHKETARMQVSIDLISVVSRKPNLKVQIGAFQKFSFYNSSAKLGHDFGFISIYKKTTTDILSLSLYEGLTGNIDKKTGGSKFGPTVEASISVISIRNSWGIDIEDYCEIEVGFHIRFGYIDLTDWRKSRLISIKGILRIEPDWNEIFN